MAEQSKDDAYLQELLDRLGRSDEAATGELIDYSVRRFQRLASKMLRKLKGVPRVTDTGDILQGASLRLVRALRDLRPDSVPAMLGLVALQIRREMVDTIRHYGGYVQHVRSGPPVKDPKKGVRPRVEDISDSGPGPRTLVQQKEWHELVDRLPEKEREVFQLIVYLDLTRAEVARRLDISESTVKRLYREARLRMHQMMGS